MKLIAQKCQKAIFIIIGLLAFSACGLATHSEMVTNLQVGVILKDGMVKDVVGPGTYQLPGNEEMILVSCQAVPFSISDEKTRLMIDEEQAIELIVEGDIFRECIDRGFIKTYWGLKKEMLLDDNAARHRATEMIYQSIHTCNRKMKFEGVSGTVIDEFEACTDSVLINTYGSTVGIRILHLTMTTP